MVSTRSDAFLEEEPLLPEGLLPLVEPDEPEGELEPEEPEVEPPRPGSRASILRPLDL